MLSGYNKSKPEGLYQKELEMVKKQELTLEEKEEKVRDFRPI